jgi:hypothetical protein
MEEKVKEIIFTTGDYFFVQCKGKGVVPWTVDRICESSCPYFEVCIKDTGLVLFNKRGFIFKEEKESLDRIRYLEQSLAWAKQDIKLNFNSTPQVFSKIRDNTNIVALIEYRFRTERYLETLHYNELSKLLREDSKRTVSGEYSTKGTGMSYYSIRRI